MRPQCDAEKSRAHFYGPRGKVKVHSVTNFGAGERGRRSFGAAGYDEGAAVGESIVNGAGIALIVVREDLLIRSGSLVVS